jgi:hypothetical protein
MRFTGSASNRLVTGGSIFVPSRSVMRQDQTATPYAPMVSCSSTLYASPAATSLTHPAGAQTTGAPISLAA